MNKNKPIKIKISYNKHDELDTRLSVNDIGVDGGEYDEIKYLAKVIGQTLTILSIDYEIIEKALT